jgi:hypothetical protein
MGAWAEDREEKSSREANRTENRYEKRWRMMYGPPGNLARWRADGRDPTMKIVALKAESKKLCGWESFQNYAVGLKG